MMQPRKNSQLKVIVCSRKTGTNLRLQVICSVSNMHGEEERGERITKWHIATTLKNPKAYIPHPNKNCKEKYRNNFWHLASRSYNLQPRLSLQLALWVSPTVLYTLLNTTLLGRIVKPKRTTFRSLELNLYMIYFNKTSNPILKHNILLY